MSNLISSRKQQLPQFKELFCALLKIPDKEIQKRVIDAINNITKLKTTVDAATQTDPESHKRRKRYQILPKAEKCDPKISLKRKSGEEIELNLNIPKPKREKGTNDLLIDFVENCEINFEDFSDSKTRSAQTLEDMIKKMEMEFLNAETFKNDFNFLPIHHAILENDLFKLKRQIYIFSYKKKPIDEILTKDDETPIQLAFKNNSTYEVIRLLLETCSNIEQVDTVGNTLIHLAVKYCETHKVIKELLKKVDFDLILNYNDDGLTPLHIAVKENKFIMCKAIFEFIDDKLSIKNTVANITYHENLDDLKEILVEETRTAIQNKFNHFHEQKYQIVNQKDLKFGRTLLFFAIDNIRLFQTRKLDSKLLLMYLILNLCDPNIQDRSEIDGTTYARELVENFSSDVELWASIQSASTYLRKYTQNDY